MIDRGIPGKLLKWGLGFAILEALVLGGWLWMDLDGGLRVLSMIGACHVGGRLAFIGTGFELGFGALPVVGIVTCHNTTFLLLAYSLGILFSQRVSHLPLLAGLSDKVRRGRELRSGWNLTAIAVFIWVPLPMTGAAVGALLAYFEGYEHRQILPVAFGAMAVGVITWTLAFEQLYEWMRRVGPYATLAFTLSLVLLPLLSKTLRKKNPAP